MIYSKISGIGFYTTKRLSISYSAEMQEDFPKVNRDSVTSPASEKNWSKTSDTNAKLSGKSVKRPSGWVVLPEPDTKSELTSQMHDHYLFCTLGKGYRRQKTSLPTGCTDTSTIDLNEKVEYTLELEESDYEPSETWEEEDDDEYY